MGREEPGLSQGAGPGSLSILCSAPGCVAALILALSLSFLSVKSEVCLPLREGPVLPGTRVIKGLVVGISLVVQSVVKNQRGFDLRSGK